MLFVDVGCCLMLIVASCLSLVVVVVLCVLFVDRCLLCVDC